MRIKSHPEDFYVKEVLTLQTVTGPYTYYLLKKRDMNLFHVLDLISQKWKISRERFGYCGIKDKRAITEQYISIKDGPCENMAGRNFEIIFIGKGDRPLKIGDAEGNLFQVTLRHVDPDRVIRTLKIIEKIGFANYFGKQRFAPDLYCKEPIAKLLIHGKFDEALREYFFHHPSVGVRRKLRKGWNGFSINIDDLQGISKTDRIVLKRFIKKKSAEYALKAYPKQIKLMFFFSYQSLLWNRVLNDLIKEKTETFTARLTNAQKISFYTSMTPDLKNLINLELPYVSQEVYSISDENIRKKIVKWVEKEHLRPHLAKKVLGLKAFSPGKRRIIVFPRELRICETHKNTATIQFFLPSGSYATVFLLKLRNYPL